MPTRHRSFASHRWGRHALFLTAASAGVLGAGCGSEAPEAAVARNDDRFCEAVGEYADAAETMDTQAMASALAEVVDGLPEDDRRTVSAHIDSLAASSSTDTPPPDGMDNQDAAADFEDLAREACGEDALSAGQAEQGDGGDDPGVAPGSSTTVDASTSSTTGPGSAGSTPSESDPSGEGQGDGESYPEGDPGSTGGDDLGG